LREKEKALIKVLQRSAEKKKEKSIDSKKESREEKQKSENFKV
jgi:hypothetical protein